jgi:ribosomal protein S18 acetylase RimI-like enzyme
MVIDLDHPLPPLPFPEGVTVRTFREEDAPAVHAMVMAAFADNAGHRYSPYDEWRGFMIDRQTFDPDLWFLAEAGGRIVAVALCPDYGANGWLRQLAVAKEYRRRGIGTALLHHVFLEQHARGNKSLGLVVDSYNRTGAKSVYENAGMRVERQHDAYEKELRPGDDT